MKIRELQKALKERRIDLAVFASLHSTSYNPDVYYFTRYGGSGVLVVPKSSPPFLVVPEMEVERARRTSSVRKVVVWPKKEKLFVFVKSVLARKKIRCRVAGLDYSLTTVDILKAAKNGLRARTRDVGGICRLLRATKTGEERKTIKEAFRIANRVMNSAINGFGSFRTELEAANYLKEEAMKNGCSLSFPTIVASGSNASMPHYLPRDIPLKKGFCVVDFGIVHKGYCTDITRTIFIGKPSEKDIGLYNFLLRAQLNAINRLREGIKCSAVYRSVQKDLRHYSKFFIHGLGHGVGLEIHETPSLSEKSKDRVASNMVFTIEPGIYLQEKFGIRIEDTILFAGKPEVLTRVPKRLVVVRG